jgi:hypothetical protein
MGGLPEGLTLDDIRIQATGPAGTTLGEIRVGPGPLQTPDTPEAKEILAHLNVLHERKMLLRAQQSAGQKAIEYLDAYQQNLTKSNGWSAIPTPASILEVSRSMEGRLIELTVQNQIRQQELEKIDAEMKSTEATWVALKTRLGGDQVPSQITVEVIASAVGDLQVELGTRTSNARWKPTYEVRVLPGGQVEMALYAAVSQASGEGWDKVQLELSSANPQRTKDAPRFASTYHLNWTPPEPVYPNYDKGGVPGGVPGGVIGGVVGGVVGGKRLELPKHDYSLSGVEASGYIPPSPPRPVLEPVADLVSESAGLFQTYRISGTKDLPSDGEARRFKVVSTIVPGQQVVVVAPRLDPTPHSVVRFDLPANLPLFPGSPLFRFVGQQRLGEGKLELPPAGQPMELALGPFQGLRTRVVNMSQTQPYQVTKITQVHQKQKGITQESTKQEVTTKGEDRIWTLKDQFILSNDSEQELAVELQDRLLKSVHESVQVHLTADTTAGSEERPAQNARVWKLTIPSRKETKVDLGLEIHAPKEGQVVGLRELKLR